MKGGGSAWRAAFQLPACIFIAAAVQDLNAGQDTPAGRDPGAVPTISLSRVLGPGQWRQLESSVDRALDWLAARQSENGSFPTLPSGQPGVTSLCVMAFLSRGHQPGTGPHGERLNRAIDYVLATQKGDGLLCLETPGTVYLNHAASHTATYNHAISGLMLGEVFGQVHGQRAQQVKAAIEKALQFTRLLQNRPKPPHDQGGWRYIRQNPPTDSDLSITAWQLMFLRSAKNAEFAVPQEFVDEAMAYVRRCSDPADGSFHYALLGAGSGYGASRGMVGAGIVSLSMGGQHNTPMALAAGNWLLQHPFKQFGERIGPYDKFFYSTYYCSQAMAQLGGRYWEELFPQLVQVLLAGQLDDGSWPPEPGGAIAKFGKELSTSLAVLSLTPPYQLLPVYQR